VGRRPPNIPYTQSRQIPARRSSTGFLATGLERAEKRSIGCRTHIAAVKPIERDVRFRSRRLAEVPQDARSIAPVLEKEALYLKEMDRR
jgi:hypothetical protein